MPADRLVTAPGGRRLHPSSFGLRTRLLALVVVPAFALAIIGGSVTRRQYTAAKTIAEVRDEATVLSDLTDLRRSLLAARAPVEVEVRAAVVGLDEATALDLLGLGAPAAPDLDAVAAKLRALPPDARPFTAERLRAVQIAARRAPNVGLIDQFDELDALAGEQWERRLVTLRARVVDSGSNVLNRQLDDLEASTRAGTAATMMLTKLADYWFGTVTHSTRTGPALAALAASAEQFDRAVADLEGSADPAVAAIGHRLGDSGPSTPFDEAVDDAIAGRPPAPLEDGIDEELVAATFTSSFEQFGPLMDGMQDRSASLDATAADLADDATRQARLTLAGLLGALALLLAASLTVAASLDRPLGRLIEGIRRVGDGDLDARPLPIDGPTEVAEATGAFNDVVANLNRIEDKVAALADSRLDDPQLREPLPGALGESMEHWISALSDSIAARDELQAQLAYQATHDALTLLPNRAGALEALDRVVARSRRAGTPAAVLFLDLDGFKAVNDTFGHQTGDDALCEVARRIEDEARAGDLCARLGGDEFVVIAENVAGVEGAIALARRVIHRIEEPFVLGPGGLHRTQLGVSIGLAMVAPAGEAPLAILARADAAAYRAKRARTGMELAEPPQPSSLFREEVPDGTPG